MKSRVVRLHLELVVVAVLCACSEPNSAGPELTGRPKQETASQSAPSQGHAESSGRSAATPERPVDELTKTYQPSPMCNIDFINREPVGTEAYVVTGPARIEGWLGGEGDSIPDAPSLLVVHETKGVVERHALEVKGSRPDVAKAFPDWRNLANSGFESVIELHDAQRGLYRIFLVYDVGARRFRCDKTPLITVR
jgi:hypothetical protein